MSGGGVEAVMSQRPPLLAAAIAASPATTKQGVDRQRRARVVTAPDRLAMIAR